MVDGSLDAPMAGAILQTKLPEAAKVLRPTERARHLFSAPLEHSSLGAAVSRPRYRFQQERHAYEISVNYHHADQKTQEQVPPYREVVPLDGDIPCLAVSVAS